VAGEEAVVAAVEARLAAAGVGHRRLTTRRAFHTRMVDPVLAEWRQAVAQVEWQAPKIPFMSTVTGRYEEEGLRDPEYWVRQVREPVRFAAAVAGLRESGMTVWVEVGPGQVLGRLAKGQGAERVVATLGTGEDEARQLQQAVGEVWTAGAKLDWAGYHRHQDGRRIPLTTYPFERQRYWVEAGSAAPTGRRALEEAFYTPLWRLGARRPVPALAPQRIVVFEDRTGVGAGLVAGLRAAGHTVLTVVSGEPGFDAPAGYRERLEAIAAGGTIDGVVHLWSLDAPETATVEATQRYGYDSVLFLLQALGAAAVTCTVVTRGVYRVTGTERVAPAQAPVVGLCKVGPQEIPGLRCRQVDVDAGVAGEALVGEVLGAVQESVVALRSGGRWVQTYERRRPVENTRLRAGGVYVITGGLGKLGTEFAEYLVRTVGARAVVLIAREGVPARETWSRVRSEGGMRARRVARAERLEALGPAVAIEIADVSDAVRMQAVWAEIEARYGRVDGVIHAAGAVSEATRGIAETTVASRQGQFRAKVTG